MGAVAIAAYRAAEAAELSSHAADFAATGGRCFGGLSFTAALGGSLRIKKDGSHNTSSSSSSSSSSSGGGSGGGGGGSRSRHGGSAYGLGVLRTALPFDGREDREAPLPVLTLRVVYDLVSLAAYRRDLSPSVQRTLAQLNGALGYGGGGGVRTLSLLHL